MVDVAQLVRAPVCGTGGRGFKSRHPPGSIFPTEIPSEFFYFTTKKPKNPARRPIVIRPAFGAGGTRCGRAGNSSTPALYDGKNCANGQFARRQFPATVAPDNTGSTIETTRARPAR